MKRQPSGKRAAPPGARPRRRRWVLLLVAVLVACGTIYLLRQSLLQDCPVVAHV